MILRNKNCTKCPLHKTCNIVCLPASGPHSAEIMLVGEAPGANEDEGGKPFIGASGRLLDRFLESAGFDRQDIYITNAVLCRPPNNKKPTKSQVNKCNEYLQARIAYVKPKIIVALGAVAMEALTGLTGIRKLRGKPIETAGRYVMPTYHPAYALRDARFEPVIENDFRNVAQILKFGGLPESDEINYRIVNTEKALERCIIDLQTTKFLAFDIETSGLDPWAQGAEIKSIAFATKKTQWIIPIFHPESKWLEPQDIINRFDTIIRTKKLIMHNGKFDALWMYVHFGVLWKIFFDTQLAQYVLNENSLRSLKFLAQHYFNAPDWDIDLDEKQGATSLNKLAKYNGHDVLYTRKLWTLLANRLNKYPSLQRLYRQLLVPLANMFVEIEDRGVRIDQPGMRRVERKLHTQLKKAEAELNEIAPDVNWNSPVQLKKLLFNDLKLKPVEFTPKGEPSTSESVLKRLDHPVTEALLRHRKTTKLLTTYIDGWRDLMTNGRIHPIFKIDGTVTGRPSCESPNLQQTPKDAQIRGLIIATKNWVLVESDLSQIELRLAADVANEPYMLKLFQKGKDAHWATAINEIARGGGERALVTKTAKDYLKVSDITYTEAIQTLLDMGPAKAKELATEWGDLRQKAKAVNFGYLYGMWWKKFLQMAYDDYGLKLTDKQAQESRIAFFQTYNEFPDWHKRQQRFAQHNGYVAMLSGRRRRLPRARDMDDSYERAEALRQAINAPIQGFASDLNLMACLELHNKMDPREYKALGTIHDAILHEIHRDYVDEIVPEIIRTMQKPKLLKTFGVKLRVPIIAEAKVGSWAA